MNFLTKLYAHVSENGFSETEESLLEEVSKLTGENLGFLDLTSIIYDIVNAGGYSLAFSDFENEYYKFWGKRPKGNK